MPAVHLNYATDGKINTQIIEYFRERAKGGAAMLIVGGCAIDAAGTGPMMIRATGEEYRAGLSDLAKAVKGDGACIAAQLYQAGRYAHSAFTGCQPVAPSPVPSRLTRETPRELETDEIPELINVFARAALLVKEAGFDAVEILASAGYIISQFFSPLTNKRQDIYGGSLENRMRFGVGVVEKVRATVGADFTVMVRLGGNDFMPGGNTNKEAKIFARQLQDKGADCFNITGGWHETSVPQTTMCVPPGTFTYLASNIKKEVSIPVVACNRINDPLLADTIIREGRADFVGIARGLIADPNLPKKARNGRLASIRKCIGCNQGCLDHVFSLQPVTCLVNARVGREKDTQINPAAQSKEILVVGGGVAGMEFARVSALRGHRVTLWEKENRLGGQLHLAAAPPGRNDFSAFGDYLAEQMDELGVLVQLNQKATPEMISTVSFDLLVIATGALPVMPAITGINLPHVVSSWDVLAGKVPVGNKVVIVGGGAVGVETALFVAEIGSLNGEQLKFLLRQKAEDPETLLKLAARGHKDITIVEMMKGFGKDIGLSTRWTMIASLQQCGISLIDNTKAVEIITEGIRVEKEKEKDQSVIEADTVIIAVGSVADNNLYAQIKEQYPGALLIGDAAKPRKALEAVHHAFELALKI